MMMKSAKLKHGVDVVNRVFDNQETCLHTAINKAEQAAVDSKETLNFLKIIF